MREEVFREEVNKDRKYRTVRDEEFSNCKGKIKTPKKPLEEINRILEETKEQLTDLENRKEPS